MPRALHRSSVSRLRRQLDQPCSRRNPLHNNYSQWHYRLYNLKWELTMDGNYTNTGYGVGFAFSAFATGHGEENGDMIDGTWPSPPFWNQLKY